MDWICEGKELCSNKTENLVVNGEYLKLEKSCSEGHLTTPVADVPRFTEITPSWNSKTNSENSVEILIRLRIEEDWTPYISYGIWSTDGNNIGIKEDRSNELVKVTADRIFVNNNKFADAVQMKVIFRGNEPELRLMAFSTDTGTEEEVTGNYFKIIDDIPMISQLASGHKDAHVICSPTSVTMVLKHYGIPVELDDVARGTFDTGSRVYGNWPQNTAYAGEQDGIRAYTKRCISVNTVKNLIAQSIPVVASVVSQDYNELEGANSAFPDGHLMVIAGFERKDGVEYIVVNDPASKSNEEVRRSYKLNQWINVWRHYIYVIAKR